MDKNWFLISCPFCGNADQEEFAIYSENRILSPVDIHRVYKVACSCGAMGSDADSESEAVRIWNNSGASVFGKKKAGRGK